MDIITHVTSIKAMQLEGLEIAEDSNHPLNSFFTIDDDGQLTFSVDKVKVRYNEDYSQSLCVIRGFSVSDLDYCNTIKAIGYIKGEKFNEYAEFFTPEYKEIYESVIFPLKREYEGASGEVVIVTDPYLIGSFS